MYLKRNTDTPEARKIWENVDRAAEKAPEWVKRHVKKKYQCFRDAQKNN